MRIPRDEMNQLHSASELQSISEDSEVSAQLESIAYSLNNAANTGETAVTWLGNMFDANKTTLEAQGYTVDLVELQDGSFATKCYRISFDGESEAK